METGARGFLVSGGESAVPAVLAFLGQRGIATIDKQVLVYPDMGVEHARRIREDAALRGITSARVFIIVATSITTEAQNALLKTLEEPLGDAVFVLVVPSPDMLLPTVRSRLERAPVAAVSTATPIDAAVFLAAPKSARIDMLKVLTAVDEKDTAGTIAFLAALERELARNDIVPSRAGIEAVYAARAYILDKGALRKALLEQVALLA